MLRKCYIASVVLVTLVTLIGSSALLFAGPKDADTKSQASSANMPAADVKPIDQISHLEMPALDLQSIRLEDDSRLIDGLAPRYAIPNSVVITPTTGGTWEDLENNARLWRLRISSPGAISINLGFTHYFMPPGGQLILRSADDTYRLRPFTDADNMDHDQLWTPPVRGSDIVVELTIPSDRVNQLRLELGSINIGYRRFGDILDGTENERSGSCNVDVKCSTGDPWRDQIPAVAVISTGGSTFCTGFMVNNVRNDRKNYFMTANHCGITSGNAASLVAYWNFENSTCRGIPGGSGTGDGQLNQFNTGSTFRASFATSDFTLVELSSPPNPAYNVSYAGWDRTGANPPSGACIHHPNTDEKRISLYDIAVRPDRPSHGSSWPCSAFPGPGDNTHIKVYWSLGVTEPGSSGSPLFDDNHRIIGQLHGGPSACGQTGDNLSDCYGRFSLSWTGGGSSATRLSDWLDPDNTGANNVDTVVGSGLQVTPGGNVTSVGVVGGPFTNPSTTYTISNSTGNSANYTVSILPGGTAPVLIDGGTGPLNGTLPNGGNVNVTVTYDASANSLPAGTYASTIRFADTTNNVNADRTHTLEIGQTGFTVAPANGLSSGGPVGGPFNATQVYTITSTRPSPVNVQVSADQSWISIDGGAGPLNFTLNGTGDSRNVTIGYSAAANALGAGLYNGTVTVLNTSGGAGGTTRPVSLEVGRFSYPSTDTPKPIPDVSTITSSITVPDTYCIADVNVDINITHTYIGDLLITLTSPAGVVVTLHNRTGGSTDDIVGTYDDQGALHADGPGTLADFNGTTVGGIWTLTIADQAAQDTGTLNSWALKIVSSPNPCPPPPQVIYNFPLDSNPGWTTQGMWAFGTPTGVVCGSGSGHDPTSGFTGANVYGYNLAGCYNNSMPAAEYVTTTAMSCSNLVNTKLRFRRWLGVESSTFDHATVDVSNNGTTWTNVFSNPTSSINESAWSLQQYNIGAVADGQQAVYVRWGMGTTDTSVIYQGWNIDDIQIIANVNCTGILVGDANLDAARDAKDITVFTNLVINPGNATLQQKCACDANGDGNIDLLDVDPLSNLLIGP